MSKTPPNQNNKPAKPGFFKTITNAIDDVVKEVKTELNEMTPPEQKADPKKTAAYQAKVSQLSSLITQSTGGLAEDTVPGAEEVPPLPPESTTQQPATSGLPSGNLWQALTNAAVSSRLRADALFHALNPKHLENYANAVSLEKSAPFTLGLVAISLPAPPPADDDPALAPPADTALQTALTKALGSLRLYGAIGAGPRQVWDDPDALDTALTTLLNANPKIIAIGPIGLDEPYAPYAAAQQQAQLALQLELAADFNLPVLLSQRQSLPSLAQVLQQAASQFTLPKLIWLDPLNTQNELDLILHYHMALLLRPELTQPTFAAQALYQTYAAQHPQGLLLASGSALVAPHGFSGHFNQPKFLENTLQAAAQQLNQPAATLQQLTNRNFSQIFNTASAP